MSGLHIVTAIAGGLCSFVGAFLVLRESARLRRAELGELGPIGRLWEEAKRTVRNPAPIELQLSPAIARSSASIGAITVRGPETPEEELRRRVNELESSLRVSREQFALEFRDIGKRIDTIAEYLETRIRDRDDKRKSDLRRAIRNQNVGTAVFLTGVVFSLASNLVT